MTKKNGGPRKTATRTRRSPSHSPHRTRSTSRLRDGFTRRLPENAELLHVLARSSPVGIVYSDTRGRCLYVNERWCGIVGTTFEEALASEWYAGVHPEDAERVTATWRHAVENGLPFKAEYRFQRRDATAAWVLSQAAPIRGSARRTAGYIGTIVDITPYKHTESAARLHSEIVGNIAEGVHLVSATDLRIIYANRRMEEIFGYEPGEMNGRPVSILYAPGAGDPEQIARRIRDALKNSGTWRGELLNIRKDGRFFWGQTSTTTTHHPEFGEVYVSLQLDVSERKQAERALRESEEQFRTITEQMADMVYVTDMNGTIRFVSSAVERIFGFRPEEMQGHHFAEFLSEAEIPRAAAVFSRALSSGVPSKNLELVMKRKNGSLFTGELNGTIHLSGELRGTIGLIRDISDRKRVEGALKLAAREWQATFDAVGDGIWLLNEHQQVLRSNKAGCDLFHRSINEVEGRMCWETAHGTTTAPPDCPFPRARQNLRRETAEFERDGRCLAVSVDPILNEQGQLLGAVHSVSDVTERRHLQAQLLQAQKMESIGRLAGGIAHDFNNMLAVILGHLELALDDMNPSEPLYDNLQHVKKAAQRSATLTRQLLGFARRQPVLPRVLNLNDTISQMTPMLERLIGEDIHLAWKPGANLWSVRIDPNQIDQILANLSVNSRDAIAGVGSIVIETSNVTLDPTGQADLPGSSPGDYVTLSVRDDGCGMDTNVLEHLFEPFFTTKDVGEGTGLGLATVHGIVKQNDGFIDVSSRPGQGAIFTIYFPRHALAIRELDAVCPIETPRGGAETVLLVEDQPAVLGMSRAILERLGYTVMTASTPMDAIRQVDMQTQQIDLLLTDVVMPQMSGWELAERLRRLRPGLRLLFMTGYAADVITGRDSLGGNVQIIQKPFSAKDLAARVRQALDG